MSFKKAIAGILVGAGLFGLAEKVFAESNINFNLGFGGSTPAVQDIVSGGTHCIRNYNLNNLKLYGSYNFTSESGFNVNLEDKLNKREGNVSYSYSPEHFLYPNEIYSKGSSSYLESILSLKMSKEFNISDKIKGYVGGNVSSRSKSEKEDTLLLASDTPLEKKYDLSSTGLNFEWAISYKDFIFRNNFALPSNGSQTFSLRNKDTGGVITKDYSVSSQRNDLSLEYKLGTKIKYKLLRKLGFAKDNVFELWKIFGDVGVRIYSNFEKDVIKENKTTEPKEDYDISKLYQALELFVNFKSGWGFKVGVDREDISSNGDLGIKTTNSPLKFFLNVGYIHRFN